MKNNRNTKRSQGKRPDDSFMFPDRDDLAEEDVRFNFPLDDEYDADGYDMRSMMTTMADITVKTENTIMKMTGIMTADTVRRAGQPDPVGATARQMTTVAPMARKITTLRRTALMARLPMAMARTMVPMATIRKLIWVRTCQR